MDYVYKQQFYKVNLNPCANYSYTQPCVLDSSQFHLMPACEGLILMGMPLLYPIETKMLLAVRRLKHSRHAPLVRERERSPPVPELMLSRLAEVTGVSTI